MDKAMTQDIEQKKIYRLQADLCRVLAHPIRLHILDNLRDGEKSVNELSEGLETTGANISSHLAVLKQTGVVVSRKDGQKIYYKVIYPDVYDAFDTMRGVLRQIILSEGEEIRKVIQSIEAG